jgi:hypothetical protein
MGRYERTRYHDIYVKGEKVENHSAPDGDSHFPTFMWNLVQSAEKGRASIQLQSDSIDCREPPIDWIGLSMYPNSEFNFGNILLKPAQSTQVPRNADVCSRPRAITIGETGGRSCATGVLSGRSPLLNGSLSEAKNCPCHFSSIFETDPIFTGPTASVTPLRLAFERLLLNCGIAPLSACSMRNCLDPSHRITRIRPHRARNDGSNAAAAIAATSSALAP